MQSHRCARQGRQDAQETQTVERRHHSPSSPRSPLCDKIKKGFCLRDLEVSLWPNRGGQYTIFVSLVRRTMSRSIKKGPYVDERLLAKVERQGRSSNREPIKTWSRDCTIVPDFIGHN